MSVAPTVALYPAIQPRAYSTPLIDTGTISDPVQFYVTFDGKAIPGPHVTPPIVGERKVFKSPSPAIETLAAPDLLSMTEIWEKEFRVIFAHFLPHCWFLVKTFQSPSPRWKKFKDSAKVRFCCQTCGHAWTSMKGRVMFWFNLNNVENNYPEGFLQYKLYGQQCNQCKNGVFEDAMWYPEEVNKVLCNVYNKIGQTYYGFLISPIRQERRAGKPRTQHNSALCQACMDGECYRKTSSDDARAVIQQPSITHAQSTVSVTTRPPRMVVPMQGRPMQHKSTSVDPFLHSL